MTIRYDDTLIDGKPVFYTATEPQDRTYIDTVNFPRIGDSASKPDSTEEMTEA